MTSMSALSEIMNSEDTQPKTIELRIGLLIRHYLQDQSKTLAAAIVKQLENLLNHPDCIGYPNHRCGYKKMLQQWRAIAL